MAYHKFEDGRVIYGKGPGDLSLGGFLWAAVITAWIVATLYLHDNNIIPEMIWWFMGTIFVALIAILIAGTVATTPDN